MSDTATPPPQYFFPQFSRFPFITDKILKTDFCFHEGAPSKDPNRLGAVIFDSFSKTMKEAEWRFQSGSSKDQWTEILGVQAEPISILRGGDPVAIVAMMENACNNHVGHGFMQLKDLTEIYKADTRFHRGETLMEIALAKGGLAALGHYLGVVDQTAPWLVPDPSIYLDENDLLERVSGAVGINIVLPNFFKDLFGLKYQNGVFSSASVRGLYTALRVKELLAAQGIKPEDAHICEIGGGAGYLACFAHLLGIGKYTVIDLPITSAVQTFHAGNVLGLDAVQTYSEYTGRSDKPLALLPTHAFEEIADSDVCMFINENSMPEIDRDISLNYLRIMKRVSGRLFLSINQESRHITYIHHHQQTPVKDLAAEVGLRRISRHPHWLTHGYCEEIFGT